MIALGEIAIAIVAVLQSTTVLVLGRRLVFARRAMLELESDNARLRLELAIAQPLFSRRALEVVVRDLRVENARLRHELGVRRGAN